MVPAVYQLKIVDIEYTFRPMIEKKIPQISQIFINKNIPGYRMVFASTCKHSSGAYIFASTSSDQICFASSKHFKKFRWRASNTS